MNYSCQLDYTPPPAPSVPEGWELVGYRVELDAPTKYATENATIADAVKKIQYQLTSCLTVYAVIRRTGVEDGVRWEEHQQAHWSAIRKQWQQWRAA